MKRYGYKLRIVQEVTILKLSNDRRNEICELLLDEWMILGQTTVNLI